MTDTDARLLLSSHLSTPADPDLADTPYGRLGDFDLAQWLTDRDDLHAQALNRLERRVHPTARIHPTAILGEDVIVGAGVRVWEFTTVRGRTYLGPGVSVGFNCEVTNCYLGSDTVLGHRIGLNRTLVGDGAHLSADVVAAAIHMTDQMTRPDRDAFLRLPDGLYRCRTPRFGALIGDRVQTGSRITLGPGAAVGRDCRIHSHTAIGPSSVISDRQVVAPADPTAHHAHQRRR
ncbi:transferase [Streptomyces sp. NPDC046985]|uniref:transferase n=1 Tax=Streptomyces sp. NPDC046985 TaxID=3155377 RepID=UPI0033F218D9